MTGEEQGMAEAPADVPEARAEGKIKDSYEDIKRTLRVPNISIVFRMLATEPDYFQLAWRALKPNAQTEYFERVADEIRSRVVDLVTDSARPAPAPDETLARCVRVMHYVAPKNFLALCALSAATNGQQPQLVELAPGAKRQIPSGVPPDMTGAVDRAEDAPDDAQPLLADIAVSLPASPYSRELGPLARWPDYLRTAWEAWKPELTSREYTQVARDIRRTAESAVTAFPFRMDISAYTLRHGGLSERQIDRVRSVLSELLRGAPAHVAFLGFLAVAVDGRRAASRSPFPPYGHTDTV